jgi:hypothetical protein
VIHRVNVSMTILSTAILFLMSIPVMGQTLPHTPDGRPDFSGIWTNVTITPFERPRDLAGKEFFTEKEAADYEKLTVQQRNRDKRNPGSDSDVASAYNDFWWDSGTRVVKTRRTSIVVDPPDGRVPALTPERQKQLADRVAAIKKRCELPGCEAENSGQLGVADGPEDRPLMERCLAFQSGGPPMLPSAYNNNYQIVQSPNLLAVDIEMAHDVRRIPLDGSPHLPAHVRQWMGDSRGRWEGDTLVVDTTNFTDLTRFRGADQNLHLTERFTYLDAETIIYRFTVDDPTAFTKPWTGEIPMVRAKGPLYEYACNEGNSGLAGILSSARTDEKKAVEQADRQHAQ